MSRSVSSPAIAVAREGEKIGEKNEVDTSRVVTLPIRSSSRVATRVLKDGH